MRVPEPNVLQSLEDSLERQRERNARGYRAEAALLELRGLVVEYAVRLDTTTVTLSDFAAFCRSDDPERRARINALLDSIDAARGDWPEADPSIEEEDVVHAA